MIESTTSTHQGNTPIPGMASITSPGSRAHRFPKITNRTTAVAISSVHWSGGANVIQIERASEIAATPNASPIFAREWRLSGGTTSTETGVNVMVFSVSIRFLQASVAKLAIGLVNHRATTAPDLQAKGA